MPAELHVFELGPHGTHFGMGRPAAERELAVTPTAAGELAGYPRLAARAVAAGGGCKVNLFSRGFIVPSARKDGVCVRPPWGEAP